MQPIGWRLGLERMWKLSTALGMPQHRFASIHVVGTNGKSSVTRMTAALLRAHGLRVGAAVSPHFERWSERTLIDGQELDGGAFSAAVGSAAAAAENVERGLEPDEYVTQFELATAASFVALAAARVEVGVIEAGLGGRLDATNTIPSRITVLTSVGLDHTEWLGGTVEEIAAEKLAVLRDHSLLVRGHVGPAVAELARRTAAERGAGLVVAPPDPGPGIELERAPGAFQRRNFALAMAVAEAFLGELDRERAADVAARISIPGRMEPVGDGPAAFLDVAHNADGAGAVAEALAGAAGGRPVVACLAMAADKDAAAFAAALGPALERVVCAELPPESGRASMAAADLAAACAGAGLRAEAVADLGAAISRAGELAGAEGVVLVSGSHYAVGPARAALRGRA